MTSINTSLSGLIAAQRSLDVTAHNIANMNTPNFKEKRVLLQEESNSSGVSINSIENTNSNIGNNNENDVNIEKQMVSLIENKNFYIFNAKAIMIADKALGTLLDEKA